MPLCAIYVGPQVAKAEISATCWTYGIGMPYRNQGGCPVLADRPSSGDCFLEPYTTPVGRFLALRYLWAPQAGAAGAERLSP